MHKSLRIPSEKYVFCLIAFILNQFCIKKYLEASKLEHCSATCGCTVCGCGTLFWWYTIITLLQIVHRVCQWKIVKMVN